MINVGEEVYMPFMGSDTKIIVSRVPDVQPAALDDVYLIQDQYNEHHFVEHNGDFWVTVPENLLPESAWQWLTQC